MNYAITAHPRSGTKFLAGLLDDTPNGTCEHDVEGESPNGTTSEESVFIKIRKRYTNVAAMQKTVGKIDPAHAPPVYGNCSGNLLPYFDRLDVDKRVIIVRNPQNIILSIINRHPEYMEPTKWDAMLARVVTRLHSLRSLARIYEEDDNHFRLLHFEDITGDNALPELISLFGWLGVEYKNLSEAVVRTKVNSSGRNYFRSLGMLGKFYTRSLADLAPYSMEWGYLEQ